MHIIPMSGPFLLLLCRWDVGWLCIHWAVQNTEQHPFMLLVTTLYVIVVQPTAAFEQVTTYT